MKSYLKLMQEDSEITIDFGDNAASRGAAIAGLLGAKSHVDILAWDEENGKVWFKDGYGG